MDFGLKDRRVLIVGGSSGIGLAIAEGFREQGSHVTISSHIADVFEAQRQLNENGRARRVEALQFDVSDRNAVIEAFQRVGHLDVLINNVGVFLDTPSTDRSEETSSIFVKQIMINLVGPYWCAIEAIPHMSDGGRIIFTASIAGKVGSPGHSSYVASKHGILGLVKCMAMDLGPLGISVNAVCPGSTATEMNLRALSSERQKKAIASMSLRPDLLDPSHHVGTYLYLASDAASEVTGQTITVDRGQTISGAS